MKSKAVAAEIHAAYERGDLTRSELGDLIVHYWCGEDGKAILLLLDIIKRCGEMIKDQRAA